MTEITPVSSLPKITDRSYTIERVVKVSDREHRVERIIYEVTTYDRNGVLSTTTNSSKVNFLV